MLIKIPSAAYIGLESLIVDVEISMAGRGLPGFDIVGLPNKAVDESKERVRTAISNSGMEFPSRKIMVNLAPADIPKEGSFYDMPIAAGILALSSDQEISKRSLFLGELSLDGSFRHIKGAILSALLARESGFKNIFLPADSANEAAQIRGVKVYPVRNLLQLSKHLLGEEKIKSLATTGKKTETLDVVPEFDMREILGQNRAKRAAEIAAAGGHNMLMIGPPGAGKTMIARALAGILPPLAEEESLQVTKIYSAAGQIPAGGGLVEHRPFRAPHHTTSQAGLIGGGSKPQPGEVSLAHRGVLFLDEFNEFGRATLEAMRQPLEDGVLTISRSRQRVEYPAKFMLVASANPCPCGYLTHPKKACTCSPRIVERYKRKLSGPLLDRIDLHINVRPVEAEEFSENQKASEKLEASLKVRERVILARNLQQKRFANEHFHSNAEMKNAHIKTYCSLSRDVETMLRRASQSFQLSARAYFKTIKVARTIADLAGAEEILPDHMAEALQYQQKGSDYGGA